MLGRTHYTNTTAFGHIGVAAMATGAFSASTWSLLDDLPWKTEWIRLTSEAITLSGYAWIAALMGLFTVLLFGNFPINVRFVLSIVMVSSVLALNTISHTTVMWFFVLAAFGFGSLLPDIDSENSTLGRYVSIISYVIPHRTITHTLWVVIALSSLAYYTGSLFTLALTLGYTIHIIQDSFSKQGIVWLYPVIGTYDMYPGSTLMKKGRNATLSYNTGGLGEWIYFGASIAVHIGCAAWVYTSR